MKNFKENTCKGIIFATGVAFMLCSLGLFLGLCLGSLCIAFADFFANGLVFPIVITIIVDVVVAWKYTTMANELFFADYKTKFEFVCNYVVVTCTIASVIAVVTMAIFIITKVISLII